ncbi:MAG: leucine-rich repeat protein, partial [Oscillospiraceae bacterium]|nr:leucine-rich repeat protein [Oscillospiraceae bacterium]
MTSDSGTLGDNFTWSYSYGSLYITGSGALPTCEELGLDQYPWADFETMDVTIDNGITSIPSGAFSAIGYVTLPKTVKYISSGAFTDLYRLQLTSYSADCVYDENAFVFAAEPAGKVTAYKGSTSEALSEKYSLEFSSMGEKLYSSYSDGTLSYYFYDDCAYVADYLGTSDVVTIPETVEGYTVKGIGGNAFAFSKITQVNMPDTITEIREKAFYSCSTLTSVKFSDKLEYIWNEAFYYCIRLSDAALPDSVLSIGDFAFYSCKTMTGLNLGENISYIGEAAFEDCSITSIEIPSSLNLIQPYTFRECHELESVTFSGAIEKIHYNAFLYTPVFETLDIPAGTEVIMGECEVERSDSGTVIVPDFVTSMYCNSYYGFSTITIGSNVREFLVPEFDMSDDYDSSLTEINVSENNPYFYAEDGVVYNKDKTVMLYAAPGHKFEDGVMTIPASVTEIRCVIINESITEFAVEEGNSVFSAYEGVLMNDIERSFVRYPSGKTDTGYIVPSFAETISEGAFYGAKLKNILIPSTVKAVEKGAFWETETDSIVFKHTESDELDLADDMEGYFITYFSGETGFISADTDYYVYDGSPAAVKFPSNAVFIDSVQSGTHGSSFTWSLKDLTLTVSGTGSMNKVNTGVYPWSSLPFTDVVFEGSGIVIPEKAFENIGTLCSADLSGVTDIGLRAFYGCRYLSEITDHDSVEFVGNLA